MNRVIYVLLLLMLLSGCGTVGKEKPESVAAVEAKISGIGAVSQDSKAYLDEVSASYAVLTEEEQSLVENHGDLMAAYDQWFSLQIAGDWVYDSDLGLKIEQSCDLLALYYDVSLSLHKDGSVTGEYWPENASWSVSDGKLILSSDESEGRYNICCNDEGISLESEKGNIKLITVDAYQERFHEVFTVVELTQENIQDYCDFQFVKFSEAELTGEPSDLVWEYLMISSKVREEGLVYLDTSQDFILELVIPECEGKHRNQGHQYSQPQPEEYVYFSEDLYGCQATAGGLVGYEDGNTAYRREFSCEEIQLSRVEGTVLFVKEEYVRSVYESNLYRYVELRGNHIQSGFWRTEFDY